MFKLNKKQIIGLIAGFIIFATIYYFFIYNRETKESISTIDSLSSNTSEIDDTDNNTNETKKIKVYIAGEIQKPGVYELSENSRIADIMEQAGGTTKNANIDKINLAYILQDGMKVRIPNKKEKTESNIEIDETESYVSSENDESYISGGTASSGFSYNTNSNSSSTTSANSSSGMGISGKININTATQTELEQLPGIGPSTALKICEYRKENGKFKNISDIKNIRGIGNAKYDKIKDLIKV